jgi:hypothetical protein
MICCSCSANDLNVINRMFYFKRKDYPYMFSF